MKRLKRWIVQNIFPVCRKVRWYVLERNKYLNQLRAKYNLQKGRDNIFIIGVPNHCNLGDYAIGYAEQCLFKESYPNANVVTVNMSEYGQDIQGIQLLSGKSDLFVLTGGGNLGNVYMDDEMIRRRTIELFPENLIILFPQTMYFTDDEEGRKQAEITRTIYNRHPRCILTARERYSQEAMESLFQRKCQLLPDVVMTLNINKQERKREGACLCLRSDLEGILTAEEKQKLYDIVKEKFDAVIWNDTVKTEVSEPQKFHEEFEKLLLEFEEVQVVITDRLHGMILAALTHTPCIVLGNYNYKVKGCYAWLADLPYLKYIEKVSEIADALEAVTDCEVREYDSCTARQCYQKFLEEVING